MKNLTTLPALPNVASESVAVDTAAQSRSGQLYFVQWLRVILISLVVAHHAAQPYGPTGGEWPIDDPVSNNWLGAFFLFNSAFFMGFFFFISGYFVSGSYDRKGGVAFVRDRVIRLGVPLVLVCLFLFGPITYLGSGSQDGFVEFLLFRYIGQWQIEMGPLWFIAQLLALSIVYALLRGIASTQNGREPQVFSTPSNRAILIYALALGIAGMIVRNFFQQDYWVDILGVIPAELVHAPQYWSLFLIGIIAGRGQWLEKLPSSLAPKWLAIGMAAFVIAVITQPFMQIFPEGILPDAMTLGGKQWGILWGLLEAFTCVGLIVGFSVLFRDRFSAPNKWMERLDQNVFGVYIFHVFILVGLQGAILNIDLPALAKFAIVTIAGLIISFFNTTLLRLIPGVKRVI
ncbi:acyltransferase family protein [Roseobacter sp.]|uniref:acyltransferase family protein n=1 Tax=Roseobacter sp. TaxID=1907202 RepID=UPI00385E52B8